jgi:hypothetical protein
MEPALELNQYFRYTQTISGSHYFYMMDHLGSVREMTDSSRNIQAEYSYDHMAESLNFKTTPDDPNPPNGPPIPQPPVPLVLPKVTPDDPNYKMFCKMAKTKSPVGGLFSLLDPILVLSRWKIA